MGNLSDVKCSPLVLMRSAPTFTIYRGEGEPQCYKPTYPHTQPCGLLIHASLKELGLNTAV